MIWGAFYDTLEHELRKHKILSCVQEPHVRQKAGTKSHTSVHWDIWSFSWDTEIQGFYGFPFTTQ